MPPSLALDVTPDSVDAKAVESVSVAEEMSDSFLAYALSVITSRAIPDVRDGLKPVQRRVLWSMQQMGVRPGTAFRKSARIVGDTMGRFHPHGDAAIYDTLVRLGQDFGRMVPLVEPQGNFGSLDDPPAASRYTECRLTEAAMDMLRDSDEETVDFRPTYDGEGVEPSVLPAALPNLLVNGTAGIAVGMATNMWPHNLSEAAACIKLVLKSRSATGGRRLGVDRLMSAMPGPDFPGGGIVLAGDGIKEAYATGRGLVRVRARTHLEDLTKRRRAIIVTELPYLVGPEQVVARVTALMADSKLDGVRSVADLSDIEGLRLSIELKPGADPTAVLDQLYQTTPLEQSRPVNCVALVDGVPTTLNLVEICEHYIRHRLEVIVRRTKYRINRAEARLHVVDGLLVALSAIDEVVTIIRSSKEAGDARTRLMRKLDLSEIQATHILDMPLRRLTSLEHDRLTKEAKGLRNEIDNLRSILASDRKQHNIVARELDEVVGQHGTPRRSEFRSDEPVPMSASTSAQAADHGPGHPCSVTLSTSGNIGVAAATESKRGRAGRHDLIAHRVVATSMGTISAVSSQGIIHHASVAELADVNTRTRGSQAKQVFGLKGSVNIVALVPSEPASTLILLTSGGGLKRIRSADALRAGNGAEIIALSKGESVVAALEDHGERDVVVVSSSGQALRFSADDLSPRTLGSGPVACMNLKPRERVVGAGMASNDEVVFFGTDQGAAKAVAVQDIPRKGRRGKGVRGITVREGEEVVTCAVGPIDAMAAITDDSLAPKPIGLVPSARTHAPRRGVVYRAIGKAR